MPDPQPVRLPPPTRNNTPTPNTPTPVAAPAPSNNGMMSVNDFGAIANQQQPPPHISDAEVIRGLVALGYTTDDAITLFSNNPDLAMTLYQGGIGPSGSGGSSGGGGGGGGGGADNTVGLAQIDLGYAQLGESQRQFDLEYQTGLQQFNATFDRKNFESDREYELAKEQFALTYAENKRQFDASYGLDSRALDLQGELGRGNLQLGRDRLGLDTELGRGELALGGRRLDLDTELGRGRLALDTELGRGELALGRNRLALDDRLGTGRLNLDTELGRGQLGVNQQAEQRLQRAQVAAERLANRDQELQRTQFVTDVLRKPSDFLARAFMQRGGTAPTGMVTQADIINNLKNSINQFAEGGVTRDSVFTTGEQGGASSTELILNPANAPLQILNPQDTQQTLNNPQALPGRLGDWQTRLGQMQMPAGFQDWWNRAPAMLRNGYQAAYGAASPAEFGQGLANRMQGGATIQPVNGTNTASPFSGAQTLGVPEAPADGSVPWRSFGHGPGIGRIGPQQGGPPQYIGSQFGSGPQSTFGGAVGAPTGMPPSTPSIQPVGGTGGVGYNPGAMQPGSAPDWNAAMQATQGTINPMTLPNVTQQQLIQIGLDNLPPAVKAALFGGAGDIPAARPVGNLTLGRLSRLTPDELEALNTQLGVQFNTNLQNEIALLQERFGPVVDRARGRLVLQ